MPVKVFDTATDGIVGPHYFLTRPSTNEIWLTLRTAHGQREAHPHQRRHADHHRDSRGHTGDDEDGGR